MESKIKLSLCFIIILSFLISCKKDGVKPTVETAKITEITPFAATCGGTITDVGSGTIIARGVCYGTNLNPTLKDSFTQDGDGPGTFTSSLGGLYSGVAYFVRAYATNSDGTGYGEMRSFSASGKSAEATAAPASNISATGATLNGYVNANSVSTVVNFQFGITSTYDSTAYALPSPVTDNTDILVSADITGLKARTLYHFRVVATNSLGTFFSGDNTFTTLGAKNGKD